MYALPVIVRDVDSMSFYPGSLVTIPDIFLEDHMIEFYSEISEEGWQKDHLGYHAFSQISAGNKFVIFPGLHIGSDPPIEALYPALSLEKVQMEKYVHQIFNLEQKAKSSSDDVNMLIHDLRSISTSIYNAALSTRITLKQGDIDLSQTMIDNIICSQTILKIRTDILDYLHNPASVIIDDVEINLAQKTLNVVDAFRSQADIKNVKIALDAEEGCITFCPNVFEFIPFVLIENAIKYSPHNAPISIVISSIDDRILFLIKSFGPFISEREKKTIFLRGVRGAHAPKGLGSGIGLYILKEVITSHFDGEIEAYQDHEDLIDSRPEYLLTEFRVYLPKREATPSI